MGELFKLPPARFLRAMDRKPMPTADEACVRPVILPVVRVERCVDEPIYDESYTLREPMPCSCCSPPCQSDDEVRRNVQRRLSQNDKWHIKLSLVERREIGARWGFDENGKPLPGTPKL